MNLDRLVSETRNPLTMHLDQASTLEMVRLFNQEDSKVPEAIERELPVIADAIDRITETLAQGGRLIYMGAGTSGRLGILDASECPPTYGVPHDMVIGLIAGGKEAILKAVEGAEDNEQLGAQDLLHLRLSARDLVVGIAASGRTPYVIGGLRYAKSLGCYTVSLSCNPGSRIAQEADLAISPVVGPEVLTGSTRMKAGTAQKLVLNMLTTGAMVKLGKVYQNLMVDVQATNEKLVDRQQRIVMEATDCDRVRAEQALAEADNHCKTAIVMLLAGLNANEARLRLKQNRGFVNLSCRELVE